MAIYGAGSAGRQLCLSLKQWLFTGGFLIIKHSYRRRLLGVPVLSPVVKEHTSRLKVEKPFLPYPACRILEARFSKFGGLNSTHCA